MAIIKTQDDLVKFRAEILEKRTAQVKSGQIQIVVGMGTCGIAAGARDTMKAVLEAIQQDKIEGVVVAQTGCIGLCAVEPVIEVIINGQPKVTYGNVTPAVVRQIMVEHIQKGQIVKSHIVSA